MLYRILTEDKNRLDVQLIVASRFDGFTILVEEITEQIRVLNHQESVLVRQISLDSWLNK